MWNSLELFRVSWLKSTYKPTLKVDRGEDSPDGVALSGHCLSRKDESLGSLVTEYEPEQIYVDPLHDKLVAHSEAKINTGEDCLGFSIKSFEHRDNTYHFIYSSKEEENSPIPYPLREGNQILKITSIDKNDESTKVLTKIVVGIGSHREVLEKISSQMHLLALLIRRKDDMDSVSFYEIIFISKISDMVKLSIDTVDLCPYTIPGTSLVVAPDDIKPPVRVNIALDSTASNGETQPKDKGWIVSKENEIILGEYHDEKLRIEKIAVTSFDIKRVLTVFLLAFRIRDTCLFLTVKGDGDHHQVTMETHILTDDNVPPQILFKHVQERNSTLESLEAPGFLLAAGCNDRLTLVKDNATDSSGIRTHLFELEDYKDPPTNGNVIMSKNYIPQMTAQTLKGKPVCLLECTRSSRNA